MHDCVLIWTDPDDGVSGLEIWLFSRATGYSLTGGLSLPLAYERALRNTFTEWGMVSPEEYEYMMPVVLITNEE